MGYEGGMNVYAYTRNNPANNADPSGLSPDGDGEMSADDITYADLKGTAAPFFKAIHDGAEWGKGLLNTAATFNPLCNTATVISGQNAAGKQVSKGERGIALEA